MHLPNASNKPWNCHCNNIWWAVEMTTLLIMQFTAACCYYRLSPYFTPFCFNAPCQYILLNLRPLIFGLTPFGWLRSLTITPPPCPYPYRYSLWDCHFWFATFFIFAHISETQLEHKTRTFFILHRSKYCHVDSDLIYQSTCLQPLHFTCTGFMAHPSILLRQDLSHSDLQPWR